MGAKLDLVNQHFGRLKVLKESKIKIKNKVTWECSCSCGKITLKTTRCLRSDNVKSCGCMQRENAQKQGFKNRKEDGESGFNKLFSSYKKRAALSGLDFNLSKSLFKLLTSAPCHYCGSTPSQKSQNTKLKKPSIYRYNGIDRVNPQKGYTEGNILPCCKVCNYAKGTMGFTEFKKWSIKLYKQFGRE